jgi:hypothetical protein
VVSILLNVFRHVYVCALAQNVVQLGGHPVSSVDINIIHGLMVSLSLPLSFLVCLEDLSFTEHSCQFLLVVKPAFASCTFALFWVHAC